MYQNKNIDNATWNEEGFQVEEGMTPAEIMENAGLNFRVEKVPSFDVTDYNALIRALMYPDASVDPTTPVADLLANAGIREVDNQFNVRRIEEDKDILTNRTVSKQYGVCQNEDFFRMPLQMAEEGKLIIETAGQIDGGKKIFMVARFTDMMHEDFRFSPDTPEDLVLPRISFFGSHDGTSTLGVSMIAYRMWCENMFSQLGGAERCIKIKHTNNVTKRIINAENILLGMREEWIERSKVFKRMVQRPLTGEEAMNTVRYVVQKKKADREKKLEEASTRTQNRVEKLMELYRDNDLGNFGKTAWDMLNAVTAFNTHERNIRKDHSRFDNRLNGSGSDYEKRANAALGQLIKV